MRMKLGVLLGFAVLAVAGSASAQGNAGATKDKEFFEVKEADGSSVVFRDDPLTAPGMEAVGATLKLRGRPVRTMLIKPRLQFLVELMKSAEAL